MMNKQARNGAYDDDNDDYDEDDDDDEYDIIESYSELNKSKTEQKTSSNNNNSSSSSSNYNNTKTNSNSSSPYQGKQGLSAEVSLSSSSSSSSSPYSLKMNQFGNENVVFTLEPPSWKERIHIENQAKKRNSKVIKKSFSTQNDTSSLSKEETLAANKKIWVDKLLPMLEKLPFNIDVHENGNNNKQQQLSSTMEKRNSSNLNQLSWSFRKSKGIDMQQLSNLCFSGISSSIRGKAWCGLIRNQLNISNKVFKENLDRITKLRKSMVTIEKLKSINSFSKLSVSSSSSQPNHILQATLETSHIQKVDPYEGDKGSSLSSGATAKSASSRSYIPQGEHETINDEEEDLTLEKCKFIKQLDTDLPRTFPELAFFSLDVPLGQSLRDILDAYIGYRPQIGYVQGMSYIGAILLLYMEKEEAFICLSNLLANIHVYFEMIRDDHKDQRFQRRLLLFEDLFKEKLPTLYKHFMSIHLESNSFVVEWIITIFSRELNLEVVARIWDSYLLHGEIFLWRTVLGLLKLLQPVLLKMNFEAAILFLQNGLVDFVEESKLFDSIASIKLSRAPPSSLFVSSNESKYSELFGHERTIFTQM